MHQEIEMMHVHFFSDRLSFFGVIFPEFKEIKKKMVLSHFPNNRRRVPVLLSVQ